MTLLYHNHPFDPGLRRFLEESQGIVAKGGEFAWECLKPSRPVYRFTFGRGFPVVVGKFFSGHPAPAPIDRGLIREYHAYLQAQALGLNGSGPHLPRFLGRCPRVRLGLLLENVPGPTLDRYLAEAADADGFRKLCDKLEKLAGLLAFFHSRPVLQKPVSPQPGLQYFYKLLRQLQTAGHLSAEEAETLRAEGPAWEPLLARHSDYQVLVHGDATPTNFLFPDGRAVAVDLERLRLADRLFDISWVAGELKHAWGWRFQDFAGSEEAIRHFFLAYFQAIGADTALADRVLRLNPFYMALAELRIARNDYLCRDYRRRLIEEAQRCLAWGRGTA